MSNSARIPIVGLEGSQGDRGYQGAAGAQGDQGFQGDPSGWTDDGATIRLTTNSDVVAIGSTSPPSGFKVGIQGHVGPQADDTYDLGSSSYRWRNVYIGPQTIYIGDKIRISGDYGFQMVNTGTSDCEFGHKIIPPIGGANNIGLHIGNANITGNYSIYSSETTPSHFAGSIYSAGVTQGGMYELVAQTSTTSISVPAPGCNMISITGTSPSGMIDSIAVANAKKGALLYIYNAGPSSVDADPVTLTFFGSSLKLAGGFAQLDGGDTLLLACTSDSGNAWVELSRSAN